MITKFSSQINKTFLILRNSFYCVKKMDDLRTTDNLIEEKKVNIDGIYINYARTGKGEHAVLLLPGFLGSIWTHMKHQMENLNNEKLTLIAWDPPGYGESRPPNRIYSKNFYERDATMACKLMKILGFDKFTVLGYSGGGITSLILAAMYPENVQKMIIVGAISYVTPALLKKMEVLRDVNSWLKRERTSTIAVYGETYLQDCANGWHDIHKYFFDNNNGDICKGCLNKIKCPSLIVWGERDGMVEREQTDYIHANITNSKLVIVEGGGHDLHVTKPNEFNELVHKFLIDEEAMNSNL